MPERACPDEPAKPGPQVRDLDGDDVEDVVILEESDVEMEADQEASDKPVAGPSREARPKLLKETSAERRQRRKKAVSEKRGQKAATDEENKRLKMELKQARAKIAFLIKKQK